MTKLTKWAIPSTGEVRRVYVERPGLKAKLWFEKSENPLATFGVHSYGNDADFSVVRVPGEPIHITEARAALADVQLDMNRCTWNEILAQAK